MTADSKIFLVNKLSLEERLKERISELTSKLMRTDGNKEGATIFQLSSKLDELKDFVRDELLADEPNFISPSLEQEINKFDGIENCLHNGAGGDGFWIKEDGTIKCGDCNRIFDTIAELVRDSNKHFFQKLRESV